MRLSELGSYLLLVSFAVQSPSLITADIKQSIDSSPFHGVAVPYVEPYHLGEIDQDKINSSFEDITQDIDKDVWPWVFLNAIVGYDPQSKGKFKREKVKFKSIKGMDIRLNQRRVIEFLNLWENALVVARMNDWPGVVLDLEPYNNKAIYDIDYLSEKTGITAMQVRKRLRRLGERMAEIAAEIYPQAKIHLLFSGLSTNKFFSVTNWGKRSISYIVEGMLQYQNANQNEIKVISGGELTIGYCNRNIKHLRKKISTRERKYSSLLSKYNSLELSAPIAPWLSQDSRTGWMTRGNCGKSNIETADQFVPIYKELEESYRYVWIYLAGHSGFKLRDSDTMSKLYPIFEGS